MTDDFEKKRQMAKKKSFMTANVYLSGQMDVYVPLLQQIICNLESLRDHFVVRGDMPCPSKAWAEITDAATYINNACGMLDRFMTTAKNIDEGAMDMIQVMIDRDEEPGE